MVGLEITLEKRLAREIEDLGGLCVKLVPTYFKGLPDRMVLMAEGQIYFVETKKDPKASMSPRQKYVRKRLRALGYPVYRVDTPGTLKAFIRMVQL